MKYTKREIISAYRILTKIFSRMISAGVGR